MRYRTGVLAVAAQLFGTSAFGGHVPELRTDLSRLRHLAPAIATPATRGRVICGVANSGTALPDGFQSTVDPPSNDHPGDPTAGNELDHRFVFIGVPQARMSVAWNMGSPTRQVLVFPSIDRGPVPYEALEFTVWGCDAVWSARVEEGGEEKGDDQFNRCNFCGTSNDSTSCLDDPSHVCELATLVGVHDDGWIDLGAAEESDDYASLWSFATPHPIVVVWANRTHDLVPEDATNNDCAGEGVWCSGEAEIDAVAIPACAGAACDGSPALDGEGTASLVYEVGGQIYLADNGGGAPESVTPACGTCELPTLSVDGTMLAYVAFEPPNHVVRVQDRTVGAVPAESVVFQSTAEIDRPRFSRAGDELLIDSCVDVGGRLRTKLLTVNLRDGSSRELRTFPRCARLSASYLPDGERIILAYQGRIFTIGRDGAGLQKLVRGQPIRDGFNYADMPALSSENSSLAFRGTRTRALQEDVPGNLFGADGDGRNLHQLTADRDASLPSWHPNGRAVVFQRAEDVWTVSKDGTGGRMLIAGARTGSYQDPFCGDECGCDCECDCEVPCADNEVCTDACTCQAVSPPSTAPPPTPTTLPPPTYSCSTRCCDGYLEENWRATSESDCLSHASSLCASHHCRGAQTVRYDGSVKVSKGCECCALCGDQFDGSGSPWTRYRVVENVCDDCTTRAIDVCHVQSRHFLDAKWGDRDPNNFAFCQ